MAFSHGSNDAQKTMGVITMALASYLHWDGSDWAVPLWIIVARGRGDGPRHVDRRLADHPHDGSARGAAAPDPRLRRRDRRGHDHRGRPVDWACRCRRRIPSARPSWVWARRAVCRRCAGASPVRSSWPGCSPFRRAFCSPGSSAACWACWAPDAAATARAHRATGALRVGSDGQRRRRRGRHRRIRRSCASTRTPAPGRPSPGSRPCSTRRGCLPTSIRIRRTSRCARRSRQRLGVRTRAGRGDLRRRRGAVSDRQRLSRARSRRPSWPTRAFRCFAWSARASAATMATRGRRRRLGPAARARCWKPCASPSVSVAVAVQPEQSDRSAALGRASCEAVLEAAARTCGVRRRGVLRDQRVRRSPTTLR